VSDTQRYKALVEADCIIVPNKEFTSEDEAEQWLEDHIRTGDLGPVSVRAVEPNDV
jgi:hypothetical protein